MSDFEDYANNLFSNSPSFKRAKKTKSDDSSSACNVRSVSINVFQGGYDAIQLEPFNKALAKFIHHPNYKIFIRYYTCDDIKSKMLTERQFVDLMLSCDIHFIITHIHQNMERLNWNMSVLYQEILRLQAHNGFPSGPQLECPIFTQNKMEYIKCLLPLKIVNPTIKINFNDRNNFENYRQQITEFVETFKNQEGCGFVLKRPFVTNSKPIFIRRESQASGMTFVDQIIHKLVSINNDDYGIYPYIMLQLCMKNKKEYKVATINGSARFNCVNNRKYPLSKAFSKKPHDELFEFAQYALEVLSQANPSAIIKDSIVRVDIFQNNLGHMVVNEFESLEANCYCGDQQGIVKEALIKSDMAIFYLNILLKYLEI